MVEKSHRYFAINKPYKMVSQFVSNQKEWLLCDLDFNFPEGTHALGRLDKTSEGLLLLTNNKTVTKLLFETDVPHKRVYLVQVEKEMNSESIGLLKKGVSIGLKDGSIFTTAPCHAAIVPRPESLKMSLHEFGKHLAQTWLEITLTEGKFHQVRKMVAAVGHPCKRLVRLSIEDILLDNLELGAVREIEEELFFELLKIHNWRAALEERMNLIRLSDFGDVLEK